MMEPVHAAWLCIVAPLVGAAATPLLARVSVRLGGAGAVGCSLVAAAAALRLLPALLAPETLPIESRIDWLDEPIAIDFGILLDPLSIVLANVVAVVSFAIMVYCLGYMREDSARTRFWVWMNSFIGSMLLLVLSGNLLFLFVGWKLVGICSYGLIGYHYRDQRAYWIGGPPPTPFVTPSQASLKALVVTGAGDMLMLGGILIVYFHAGTLNVLALQATAATWLPAMAATPGLVVLVSVLLLAGPIGKSAQFPLHEWLPEAMAGPGPVSALIHAATMVKCGVYFVARLVPIFYVGHWVAGSAEAAVFFHLTAWVGALTALLGATQGLVALELKKVLAYSTISQIGYMMLALGTAGLAPGLLLDGYTAGLFHLISHALFKACLFLCAGTVIHAVHSIYIHEMGGLRASMPLTWAFVLVAAAALVGLPPLPGFWSKDAVLLAAFNASTPLFVLGLVTVGLTAFYTVRCIGMVFHGPAGGSQPHGGHAADGSVSMRLAVGALVLLTLLAGVGGPWLESILHHGFETGLPAPAAAGHAGGASHTLVSVLALSDAGGRCAAGRRAVCLAIGLAGGAARALPGAGRAAALLLEPLGYRRVLRAHVRVGHAPAGRSRRAQRGGPAGPLRPPPAAAAAHREDRAPLAPPAHRGGGAHLQHVVRARAPRAAAGAVADSGLGRTVAMPALLLQMVVAPAAAAAVIFATRRTAGRHAGWIAAASLLYTTALALLAGIDVSRGEVLAEEYLLIAPGIRLGLLADGLSLPVLVVVCVLCAALSVYSIRYIEHRVDLLYGAAGEAARGAHFARFFYLFLFFPVGFIGTILSTNLVSLYFFLEVLTITLFFLMAFFGYRERVRVAFVSLAWGIAGALLFLVAALMVYSSIGTLEIAELQRMAGDRLASGAIVLFLVGLMMKLALVPFHVWMPWVHAEHPTCIAGLLAVYANLALYVIVRVLVIPLGADFEPFGAPLMALALLTMVYGSLLTLAQTDIKRLAACSTISQIAYSVLGLGALTAASVEGGMFFFLSHVMGKTLLFSTAGIVVYTTGVRDMREMGGLARRMPVTAALWILGCMMLSGFPPFSSFTAEWIMFSGVFERGLLDSPAAVVVALGGLGAILLTVAYTFGAARRIFFGPLPDALDRPDIRDPAWTMTVPLFAVAGLSIVLGLYPRIVMDLFHGVLAATP